ncbi:MAG: BatD like domain [Verrucomicrobiota bacterium]|jgi:hypothetical protein
MTLPMIPRAFLMLCFPLLVLGMGGTLVASTGKSDSPSVAATLSHRGAKIGKKVELVISVRGASNPLIECIERPPELVLKAIRRRQLLHTGEGDVWLFRYRILPSRAGDYEIPPIRIVDGGRFADTKPLFLRVSANGEPPALTGRELSLAVDIPPSLCEEVIKSAPQPTPKPEPTPKQRDGRPFASRVGSTLQHLLKDFWEYPGG